MMKSKQATARSVPAPEILPAIPEQQLTSGDGQTILSFLQGIAPFFREAQTLEANAREQLAKARLFALPKPGDIDGDANLQAFIKTVSSERKKVEQHWQITQVFSQMHKKLVAGRERGVSMLKEAGDIAQRLHNTFAEDARRRAQAEQDRIDREARERAEADRQRELAALEEQALAREAESADLSDRERRFTEDVARGVAPTDAAQRAGFKDARHYAERLLAMPKIKDAIKAIADAAEIRRQAAAVKETPVDVQTQTVKPEVAKVGSDRTTYTADVFDERLLIEAILGGRHGIPSDVLTIKPAEMNRYARDLREVINRWPGVKLVKKTTTV